MEKFIGADLQGSVLLVDGLALVVGPRPEAEESGERRAAQIGGAELADHHLRSVPVELAEGPAPERALAGVDELEAGGAVDERHGFSLAAERAARIFPALRRRASTKSA